LPILLIAFGSGICRGGPPSSHLQQSLSHGVEDKCRARFLPLVGSTIRVTNYVWLGKPGPGITFESCHFYLEQAARGPKLDRLGARKHQKVTLRGIIGYFATSPSPQEGVQGVPEYFYIEVQRLTDFGRRTKPENPDLHGGR
jgi:hypothetical protein